MNLCKSATSHNHVDSLTYLKQKTASQISKCDVNNKTNSINPSQLTTVQHRHTKETLRAVSDVINKMTSRRGSLTHDIGASLANLGALATRRNSSKRPTSGLVPPNGVPRISSLKRHSLASVELGSWTSRAAHRRGSSLPLPFCAALGPVEAAKRAEAFEGVQAAIIKLFQRNPLKENELGTLQESMRALSDAEAGPLIYEYYKDQLLKKGMVILREKIKNDQGAELVEKLGETWDYFFTQILPTLQALMYPLAEASKDMDIRNTTLLEFRNIVVLKVGLKEVIDSKKHEIPANIRQMLLVLQGLHDPTFLSKEQLDLEKLVACVVVPFLGSRGLYQGGPDPVTKANYRPVLPLGPRAKPQITITVSDAAADLDDSVTKSPRLIRLENHPIASPASMRKLHEPSSSHGVLNHRLKPVMEVLDVGRRHSIVGT